MFGKNLQKYLNQIINTEPYFLMQPTLKVNHWADLGAPTNAIGSQQEVSEVVTPLYGMDPKGIRDWNEEFQVVRDFPSETVAQRAQRDRAV